MPDYIMRWLASRFIDDLDLHEDLGILTKEVRARKDAQQALFSRDTAGAGQRPANGTATATRTATAAAEPRHQPEPSQPAAAALTDTPPVVPARMPRASTSAPPASSAAA